ncbi:MAG TPA: DoxX family protein [Ignavibacteriaceae bacterium]|jgi:putative oxidoreductase
MTAFLNKSTEIGLLIIRITLGVLLSFHGFYKLLNGIGWMEGLLSKAGLPFFIGYGVFIGEIIAPMLIIIGYRTRIAALAVVFNMLMAVLLVFRDRLFTLKDAGGGWIIELETLFFACALALFLTGGGKYAVSAKSTWD